MKGPVRVLFVDDSQSDVEMLLRELNRVGFSVQSERVDTKEAMAAALENGNWNIILCDHSMPNFDPEGALDLLKKYGNDIPLVVVSGATEEEAAVSSMQSGAVDFIHKGSLTRLAPVIERELRGAQGRRTYHQAEETIAYMAHFDPLTGLPNRVLLKDRFDQAMARAKRNSQTMALMFLDVDRFKNVNDSMGHSTGDLLLQDVVARLKTCVREVDTICRWGGDEFVLLFTEVDKGEAAARIAQRMLECMTAPFLINSQELFMTASIGIALYPNDGEDMDTLLRNADTAMFRVKEQSHNNYQLYTRAMNAQAFEQLAMEASLRRAMEREELVVYYQPQFELKNNTMVGVEALIRWHHPDLGFIYPSQFLPLAEETGLIVPMGKWVLRTACAQAKAWHEAGLPVLRVNVNLSARQFQDRKLVERISETLDETGLDPRYLELEIKRMVAGQYAGFTLTVLRDLKALGVKTLIDDFGTGYSSVNSSKQFMFDKLKIDQGFVQAISAGSDGSAIVSTLIALGKSLNTKVIAAGVETQEQLEFLRKQGCDEVQGYLFSRPVPPEEIPRLLEENVLLQRGSRDSEYLEMVRV